MGRSFYIATLGCPKNEVDSAKLAGRFLADGYGQAVAPEDADVIVVNTCAFIEPAREESIDTILHLSSLRRPGARLAVTGCLAERSGDELAAALPEVDIVAGFGHDLDAASSPVRLRARSEIPAFDLLELPRPASSRPWAYVKVAEGCDRRCGFCAIPSFRGRQRSRTPESVMAEVEALGAAEIVLVAQDLASYGHDRSRPDDRDGDGIVELVEAVAARVERVRLLYLYPSSLTDRLIDGVVATGVPYFDLSLQHASGRLLRHMRRYGNRARFLDRIARVRSAAPDAALRSSFILGYPGEREEDHDELLGFLEEAELDWAGFFTFSKEEGTFAAGLGDEVDHGLALERLRECAEIQDRITAAKRAALVGSTVSVLVDEPGVARSYREAPEIDGIIRVPTSLVQGSTVEVTVTASVGPDLESELLVPCPPATMVAS
jgi:ribosomal protein S12 methylthiotransferase